jgi:hypothetical protein
MNLFERKTFNSHSGLPLQWKIECDALTVEDLSTLAFLVSLKYRFGSVVGVPTGGLRFASALQPYCTSGPRLIVDDVLTTGKSINEYKKFDDDIGVVIFSRGSCPDWVTPIFEVSNEFSF